MARKTNRVNIMLACEECNRQNYTTKKNKVNEQTKKHPKRVSLKKFCPQCGKHTVHKEARIKKGKSPKLRH